MKSKIMNTLQCFLSFIKETHQRGFIDHTEKEEKAFGVVDGWMKDGARLVPTTIQILTYQWRTVAAMDDESMTRARDSKTALSKG